MFNIRKVIPVVTDDASKHRAETCPLFI